jgi:peroxiredoxin
MRKIIGLALLTTAFNAPAYATLKPGDAAAPFSTQAALAGNQFTFNLDDALKTGPVVLYFYPAAFTKGCSLEARAFADATDQFKAMGATVIGMSKDDIETLKKFSTADCGSKFAVGADESKTVMKAYDAVLLGFLPMSERTSYVISPEKKIIAVYSAFSPDEHVEQMLAAVKKWRETNPMPVAEATSEAQPQ